MLLKDLQEIVYVFATFAQLWHNIFRIVNYEVEKGHLMLDAWISHRYLTSNVPVTDVQLCENILSHMGEKPSYFNNRLLKIETNGSDNVE